MARNVETNSTFAAKKRAEGSTRLTIPSCSPNHRRTTISVRTTGNGGGIAISALENSSIDGVAGPPVMLYGTVYGNTATGSGGGIWIGHPKQLEGGTQGQVTIKASIVAGNNGHAGSDIAGSLATLGYNLVGDRYGATFLDPFHMQSTDLLGVPSTNLGIDPQLKENTGSTWTHALLPGSPAIDRISCHLDGISTDQRGVRRPDGNETTCDIGAYESSY